MKNYSIFAAFNGKNIFLMLVCGAIFVASNTACYAVTIKGYQPLEDCCASNVGNCSCQRIGEDSLLHLYALIFHSQMARTMKDYSDGNNSTVNVTPDNAKVVNPLLAQLSQTNNSFLPTKIGHQTTGMESHIEGDIRDHTVEDNSENSQELSDVESSVIVGTDADNAEINASNTQTIGDVSNATALGCSFKGNNNTIIFCPKELIDFMMELLRKGANL